MTESLFLPEGRRIKSPENQSICASLSTLYTAMTQGTILEGITLQCTPQHDLVVQVGPFIGHIPREEVALGVAEGTTRDIAILTRVGKPVSFVVTQIEGNTLLLSRRKAQELALRHLMDALKPGMVIPATVTHLEPFGAFVDIGCGVVSMIGIEQISISRIPHPNCRFTPGQEIFAVVVDTMPHQGRVLISHRELLGTWLENVAAFSPGMVVQGIVRGVKPYGAFVELSPNLSGLADYRSDVEEGDRVSVYIKGIYPQRMKLKLLVLERLPPCPIQCELQYFIQDGRLAHWQYAPPFADKISIERNFL